jgi:hypothetical protein
MKITKRNNIRRRFTHTKSGRLVRRKTSSVSRGDRFSPRDNERKPDMLWMFAKLQEFEELKLSYKEATNEIELLKSKLQTAQVQPIPQ